MSTTNIDRFNEIVGVILGLLYESFPLKTDLMAVDVVGKETETNYFSEHDSEVILTVSDDDAIFYLDTIDWLKESGYLTGQRSSDGIHNVVLTAKGLEVLNATPESLGLPLGVKIVNSVKSEGKEALRSLVSQALGIGLQYVTRGIL
ncbi:hypothetical protein [Limnobaculum parvum]|uniref:Uncharacterized protein n=1 Tax=Limnobaculum parvum TaxID=2172103 RepID=A0A2Y9TWM1_9GAMM|nr:hypothetical protein [Limnobaculum parvum]AWH87899.1 hypothetical protein HYN51_04590 [Limnobaculum parvum]